MGLYPPTPSDHRLPRGLPGYLILFAPHAFEPQRQFLSSKVEGEFDPQKHSQNIQIPYVKNGDGEIYQPLFSDMWEFQKFNKNSGSKFRIVTVPFKGLLPSLIKDAKGYILNPAGVSLILLRERLKAMGEQAGE